MKLQKRGSISLSINAIVVVVLAFVMLGLGLAITNTIFGETQELVPEAIGSIKFNADATAQNPLTIPDTVTIKRNSVDTRDIEFYNSASGQKGNVTLNVLQCMDSNGGTPASGNITVNTIPQTVQASEAIGYRAVIKTSYNAGSYVCVIAAQSGSEDLATKQFTLEVTS